jgi:hypothetical protein
LNIGDVSVHLACEHAHNLADRVQEAIDARSLYKRPVLVATPLPTLSGGIA